MQNAPEGTTFVIFGMALYTKNTSVTITGKNSVGWEWSERIV